MGDGEDDEGEAKHARDDQADDLLLMCPTLYFFFQSY